MQGRAEQGRSRKAGKDINKSREKEGRYHEEADEVEGDDRPGKAGVVFQRLAKLI